MTATALAKLPIKREGFAMPTLKEIVKMTRRRGETKLIAYHRGVSFRTIQQETQGRNQTPFETYFKRASLWLSFESSKTRFAMIGTALLTLLITRCVAVEKRLTEEELLNAERVIFADLVELCQRRKGLVTGDRARSKRLLARIGQNIARLIASEMEAAR